MTQAIDRAEGRYLFGADPTLYHAARPEYPERVYAILADRCGLAAGKRVFEVGPGSGRVTMRLLRAGAFVGVIEPDRALAEHLVATAKRAGLEVDLQVASFEEVELPAESFHVGVAATSFHWIEQPTGLRKARELLLSGGWWAMWWNVFNDPNRADPFYDATTPLFRTLAHGPSAGDRGRPPFALDVEARTRELAEAGFENIEVEVIPWTACLNTAEIRALYSTFSPIARLPPAERKRILDELSAIAESSFGGRVERAFVTALYTCQRP